MFKPATKKQLKLRLLIEGASGSGKTYSAMVLAQSFGSFAVIDTEKESASLYSDHFKFDTWPLSEPYEPERYIRAIKEGEGHYDTLIIDSMSHEWSGKGGCLDIQSGLGGRYQDWAKVTPRHNNFVNAILSAKCHIICTARTKSDYEIEKEGGKTKIRKVGLKTEQRDGLDYEFSSVLRLNADNYFVPSKDRTGIFQGQDGILTEEHGKRLLEWLDSGTRMITADQKESINKLMDKYGINDKANFFNFVLGDGEKTYDFADGFIRNFDLKLCDYKERG